MARSNGALVYYMHLGHSAHILQGAILEILQHAKFVLTDSGLNVDAFLESLKAEISKDRAYRACAETCFKVCENTDDVRKIQSIIAAGSTVKNTDPTDRGPTDIVVSCSKRF